MKYTVFTNPLKTANYAVSKKLIVLMLLFQGFTFFASAQVPGQKLVPKVVLDKFATDFPSITARRWEVKIGKQYEAVLIHNNKACRARYFATGEKHFTSYHYQAADVPSAVSTSLLSSFAGFKIEWATQVINHKNNTDRYWVRLTKPGFVLKAFVNADGTAVADMKEEDMKDHEGGN